MHPASALLATLSGVLALVAFAPPAPAAPEPAAPESTASEPSDPYWHMQWNMRQARVHLAWERTTGEGAVIAIVGGGVDRTHPEFHGRALWGNTYLACDGMPTRAEIVRAFTLFAQTPEAHPGCGDGDQYSRAPSSTPNPYSIKHTAHGTGEAGIAAAGRNGRGIVGAAPDALLLPVKFGDANSGDLATVLQRSTVGDPPDPRFDQSEAARWALDAARALRWATDNGADVISMSFATGYVWPLEDSEKGFTVIKRAVDYAVDAGVVVVASAGNNRNAPVVCDYPAYHPGVVCVTGSNFADTRATGTIAAGSYKPDKLTVAAASAGEGLGQYGNTIAYNTGEHRQCELSKQTTLYATWSWPDPKAYALPRAVPQELNRSHTREAGPCADPNAPEMQPTDHPWESEPVYHGYANWQGTSFATPLVAGVAAMLVAQGCDQQEIHHLFRTTSRHRVGTEDIHGVWTPALGWGIVDAERATRHALTECERRATTTAVLCERSTVDRGESTCTATVSDRSRAPRMTPRGTVTWSSTPGGSLKSDACELSGAGDAASCSVTYRGNAIGVHRITATYGGSVSHQPSTGSFGDGPGASGAPGAERRSPR